MRIIIDAFGGDKAPAEVIKGARRAKDELDVEITLVGDCERIKSQASQIGVELNGIELADAKGVISMCDEPTSILKENKDCSMAVGLRLLSSGGGDAFVSAGSTGALVVGATFLVKRLKGVKRAALATVMPTSKGPCMLLDCGANSDCRPEMLTQFGIMGDAYMSRVMGISRPRVALANIGSERTKGRELEMSAYSQLEGSGVNFIGNIEGRQIPLGDADVVVADGFSGNLILKTIEGMGKMFSIELKGMLASGPLSMLGALILSRRIKGFKKKMDYSEYGGAPLLGTLKPVIKAHGSSDAKAIFNAVRQAKTFVSAGVIDNIKGALENLAGSSESKKGTD